MATESVSAAEEASSRAVLFANFVNEHPMAREVVTVPNTLSISDAIRVLFDQRLSAAPVYDEAEGRYVGWIDIRDLVAFVSELHGTPSPIEGKRRQRFGLDLGAQVARTRTAERRPVKDLVDLSRMNAFVPVELGRPSLEVLDILSGGVHRVPVIDPSTKRIVKIISQSDIVQFLSLHLDELGSKVDRTVRELGLGSRPVIAVAANASPLEAFQMMAERRLSALPVVHPMTGQIVTNVSASDVKAMCARHKFDFMDGSVLDFVARTRQSSVADMVAAVVVTEKDTLRKVISKLAACRVHRVYVIDERRHPLAVVSLKDILKSLGEA